MNKLPNYALVLSNDLQDPDEMLALTEVVAPHVDAVKIGVASSMVPGSGVLAKAMAHLGERPGGAALFADYKVADIGHKGKDGWQGTNAKIVGQLAQDGAEYITCHTFPGISSIEECVDVAHENGAQVLTLPGMTGAGCGLFFGMPIGDEQLNHMVRELEDYGEWRNDILYTRLTRTDTITEAILVISDYFGVDGFIGPANNPEVLESYRKFTKKTIWSPGFGRQEKTLTMGEQIERWAKIVGPNSAMIVGSSIYKADDPVEAAIEIRELRDKVIADAKL